MTASSYFISLYLKMNLIEPFWINVVLFKNHPKKRFLGWIMHYITGIGFVYLLFFLIQFLGENFFVNGFLLGVFEGLIGIVMWHLLFKITFKPKRLNLKWYYLNLLLVHVIFCYTALYYNYNF